MHKFLVGFSSKKYAGLAYHCCMVNPSKMINKLLKHGHQIQLYNIH